jgi:beta-lactamase class A
MTIDRRCFTTHALRFAASATTGLLPAWAAEPQKTLEPAADAPWRDIERDARGRLGVAVLDTADGHLAGHRLDERFPMCSTFKWLAAAMVLARVDAGTEGLDRRIRFGREVLLPHSPVTSEHAGRAGMTLAELCEATITVSDNAAANLILAQYGGPASLTRYARSLGDRHTRLDRTEPALNEATPGDPRDTTTPAAMVGALRAALLGDALSPASRQQLQAWMEATRTNLKRLRADLPEGWRLGSKTGTGARGSTNDVGVYWPPGRPPVVVAVYLTESNAPDAQRQWAIARVARWVTRRELAPARAPA